MPAECRSRILDAVAAEEQKVNPETVFADVPSASVSVKKQRWRFSSLLFSMLLMLSAVTAVVFGRAHYVATQPELQEDIQLTIPVATPVTQEQQSAPEGYHILQIGETVENLQKVDPLENEDCKTFVGNSYADIRYQLKYVTVYDKVSDYNSYIALFDVPEEAENENTYFIVLDMTVSVFGMPENNVIKPEFPFEAVYMDEYLSDSADCKFAKVVYCSAFDDFKESYHFAGAMTNNETILFQVGILASKELVDTQNLFLEHNPVENALSERSCYDLMNRFNGESFIQVGNQRQRATEAERAEMRQNHLKLAQGRGLPTQSQIYYKCLHTTNYLTQLSCDVTYSQGYSSVSGMIQMDFENEQYYLNTVDSQTYAQTEIFAGCDSAYTISHSDQTYTHSLRKSVNDIYVDTMYPAGAYDIYPPKQQDLVSCSYDFIYGHGLEMCYIPTEDAQYYLHDFNSWDINNIYYENGRIYVDISGIILDNGGYFSLLVDWETGIWVSFESYDKDNQPIDSLHTTNIKFGSEADEVTWYSSEMTKDYTLVDEDVAVGVEF